MRGWVLGLIGAAACASPPSPSDEALNARWLTATYDDAQASLEREDREMYAARSAILKRLALTAGQSVADVGAGSGFFSAMMADAVGPSGRVVAVDIAPQLLAGIDARARSTGRTHIETVRSTATDVMLAAGSVDLVFTGNTYHHFSRPKAMLASIRRALRPGGALVVVDFERVVGVSADWVLKHVRAGKKTVIDEIEAAGFEFVDAPEVEGLRDNYLLRFRRP
jgi:ubiquinone/menaquinone biosynthesis C-methylase UbiE